jgi:hypothetical protein
MLNHERTAALIVFALATLTIIGAWIFEWLGSSSGAKGLRNEQIVL